MREHIVNNMRQSDLVTFLMDLYEDQRIQSLYDTLGMVSELKSIENQYFFSRDKVSFFPFVKSLLKRTKEFAKVHSKSTEEMKVIELLIYRNISKNFSHSK